MTLNPFWHLGFGSCRFIGNCSTVHVASDQVQPPRELGVVQAWLSLSARRTRSREERGSFMRGSHTPMTEEALPSGLVRAVWSTRYMCGFQQAGRQWLQSGCLVCRPIQGRLLILSMGSLLQGFPSTSPGYILGTNLGTRLLVPVEQCQTWIVPKWCIKSVNGHCQVQQ